MADHPFLHRLAQGPLLADGAMGTELQQRGALPINTCFEHLNLTNPALVREIHLDYIKAGAELLETNTYGANALRLGQHGLEGQVRSLNRRAVELAREAQRLTGQKVWVAGAIGPLGKTLEPIGTLRLAEARAAFQEQALALGEAGVDLLLLETFTSLAEVREAIAAAKAVGGLPIIVQLTFTQEGLTPAGDSPKEVVRELEALEVDVLGTNCSVGSEPMLRVLEAMGPLSHTPLSALPNAGFPQYVDGRFVYLSSPSYMAGYAAKMLEAGAAIVGGCCGTTPEHIAAMRDALRDHRAPRRRPLRARPATSISAPETAPPTLAPEPTALAKRVHAKEFVVTVEVHPLRGFDISPTLLKLRQLLGRVHVDAFNATDMPLAQGRMSPLAMSTLLQSRLGVEAIMHVATRYRNLLALHSDLLGAHALGVRNVIVMMGDPPSIGDYPNAVSFSDVTSSGLIRLIHQANNGLDLSGKPLEQPTNFFVGCALNLEPQNLDAELASLERKVAAGADFIFTQSVYDPEAVERMHRRLGGFPLPLIISVLPLRSYRHAEFLHNEVPGMVVPEAMRQRMKDAGKRAADVGVALAQELITAARGKIAGVYFVPSFGHYEVVADVLEGLPAMRFP
ncbi:MAG: bifunctional homocysteine S-methyltransferase/methylenetetrahydrofolate reductase [Chloroflexi bacterium]|nr:bifunctional homocysteine S-methyltransferase/methylenetetrahydrofolate reductase [Chloroflexota bacterium]